MCQTRWRGSRQATESHFEALCAMVMVNLQGLAACELYDSVIEIQPSQCHDMGIAKIRRDRNEDMWEVQASAGVYPIRS